MSNLFRAHLSCSTHIDLWSKQRDHLVVQRVELLGPVELVHPGREVALEKHGSLIQVSLSIISLTTFDQPILTSKASPLLSFFADVVDAIMCWPICASLLVAVVGEVVSGAVVDIEGRADAIAFDAARRDLIEQF